MQYRLTFDKTCMSHSICGLIVPQREDSICSAGKLPFVKLAGNVSLIPLDRDYLFLTDGDITQPKELVEFSVPQWLSDLTERFTKAAYIEAEFWGGSGMQASTVIQQNKILFGPVISIDAINSALRVMDVDDDPSTPTLGVLGLPFKDLFDVVGLGRHRSVDDWLREHAEKTCNE
jgi:hypothetical protein